MRIQKNGTLCEVFVEGPISEKSDLFYYNMSGVKELVIDFDKMTFINSVGVQSWVSWTFKLPSDISVKMRNCTFLIMNQINSVHSFMPRKAVVESLKAPFLCPDCNAEKFVLFQKGKEYDYKVPNQEPVVRLPVDLACPKCSAIMEPDFVEGRFFVFLKLP